MNCLIRSRALVSSLSPSFSLAAAVTSTGLIPNRFIHKCPRPQPSSKPSSMRWSKRMERKQILDELNAQVTPPLIQPGQLLPFEHKPIQAPLFNIRKEPLGEVSVHPEVFGVAIRPDIVHRVVHWQLAKRRVGLAKTKTKGEVSGTGKKPYRQKGTGRARAGSLRNPHMRGGGRAHGPVPRDYYYHLNKKIRRQGLTIALTAKLQEGNLFVLDSLALESHKTKELRAALDNWQFYAIVLIHGEEELTGNMALAARNLQKFDFLPSTGANVYDIVRASTVFITVQGLRELELRLTTPLRTIDFVGDESDEEEGEEESTQAKIALA